MKFDLDKKFDLTITVPESKSVGHRALIVNFLIDLAQDRVSNNVKYPISANIDDSQDIIATKDCINNLAELSVKAKEEKPQEVVLPCKESGSTLRFFIPVAIEVLRYLDLLGTTNIRFKTAGRLFDRPTNDVEECLGGHGIEIIHEEDSRDIIVKYDESKDSHEDEYAIDGTASSQNISGLIMALPLNDTSKKVTVLNNLNSATYVMLTLDVLKKHDVGVNYDGDMTFEIEASSYKNGNPAELRDGDWSSGAFFLCMKELADSLNEGKNLDIQGLTMDSYQGDKAIVDFIEKFKKAQKESQKEFSYDCKTIPDIVPYMAVWAALFDNGNMTGFKTTFENVGRLKIKESDRIQAIIEILDAIEAKSDFDGENLTVYTSDIKIIDQMRREGRVISLSSHNDHRMAMTDFLLALGTKMVVDIDNIECMTKSCALLPEIMTKNFAI